jgi:hypothetical protein
MTNNTFMPAALRQVVKPRKYLVRDKTPKVNVIPTDRDIEIFKYVHENRFAATHQIITYLRHFQGYSASANNLKTRLTGLFHNQYLDRPMAQQIYFKSNENIVYSLGEKGAAILAALHDDQSIIRSKWTNKNNRLKGRNLCHDLITAEFILALRIACKNSAVAAYVGKNKISAGRLTEPPVTNPDPLAWKIPFKKPYDLVPDSAFALRITGSSGRQEEKYFFVETDMSTMPDQRYINVAKNSSVYSKLVAYIHSRDHKLFSQNFGFKKVRILFLVPSDIRIKNIISLNKKINRTAKGLFLFTNLRHIDSNDPAKLLEPIWLDGRGDPSSLIG